LAAFQNEMGTRWCGWLRYCAGTRRVIRIFHWLNPASRRMALVLTHPVTEMSTRGISLGAKAAVC